MANKSQIAYTQYIKTTLDRVRELKEQGHDVTECNRLMQSIVAAVIDSDFNCADFLINELERVIQKIESLKAPSEFQAAPIAREVQTHPLVMPYAEGKREENFKIVLKNLPVPPQSEEKSKLLIAMVYVFLTLFIASVIALIAYIIKYSTM